MKHMNKDFHCNQCGFEPETVEQIERRFYSYMPKVCRRCHNENCRARKTAGNSLYFEVHSGFDNPTPYKRTTQRAKHADTGYKKYQEWKDMVTGSFVAQTGRFPHQIFSKNVKYKVDVMIYFKNKKHGDPDNIFKGIADSVFQAPLNDKYLCGSFDFAYDRMKPRVEVTIKEVKEAIA